MQKFVQRNRKKSRLSRLRQRQPRSRMGKRVKRTSKGLINWKDQSKTTVLRLRRILIMKMKTKSNNLRKKKSQ